MVRLSVGNASTSATSTHFETFSLQEWARSYLFSLDHPVKMSQIIFRPTLVHNKGRGWKITVATETGNIGTTADVNENCRTKDQWIRVSNGKVSKNSAVDKVVQLSSLKTASCIAIHVGKAIRIQSVRVTGWIDASGAE